MVAIEIVCVGGTIDKIYYDAKSDYKIGDPAIVEVLNEFPVNIDYQLSSLMRKDSLDMDDADRAMVAKHIAASTADKILITHGTDSMVQTAGEIMKQTVDKIVVLTGALQPAIFKRTDAVFNIGVAIGALQSLPHGVYIAMNGEVFPADDVRKDLTIGKFVRLDA